MQDSILGSENSSMQILHSIIFFRSSVDDFAILTTQISNKIIEVVICYAGVPTREINVPVRQCFGLNETNFYRCTRVSLLSVHAYSTQSRMLLIRPHGYRIIK